MLSFFLWASILSVCSGKFKSEPKYYSCNRQRGFCEFVDSSFDGKMSQNICLLTCGNGTLWPSPTGKLALGGDVKEFCKISLVEVFAKHSVEQKAVHNFLDAIKYSKNIDKCSTHSSLTLNINIKVRR